MKISPNGPNDKVLADLQEKYLNKKVTVKYGCNGDIKEGIAESFGSTGLSLRTDLKEVLSLPYRLNLEIDKSKEDNLEETVKSP